jgi:hypothetical protein
VIVQGVRSAQYCPGSEVCTIVMGWACRSGGGLTYKELKLFKLATWRIEKLVRNIKVTFSKIRRDDVTRRIVALDRVQWRTSVLWVFWTLGLSARGLVTGHWVYCGRTDGQDEVLEIVSWKEHDQAVSCEGSTYRHVWRCAAVSRLQGTVPVLAAGQIMFQSSRREHDRIRKHDWVSSLYQMYLK